MKILLYSQLVQVFIWLSTLLILRAFHNCEWPGLLGNPHALCVNEPGTFYNRFIMPLIVGTYSKPCNIVGWHIVPKKEMTLCLMVDPDSACQHQKEEKKRQLTIRDWARLIKRPFDVKPTHRISIESTFEITLSSRMKLGILAKHPRKLNIVFFFKYQVRIFMIYCTWCICRWDVGYRGSVEAKLLPTSIR